MNTFTFPTSEIFDGTMKTVPFDESQAWCDMLLGVMIAEMREHATHLEELFGRDFKTTTNYTRFLSDADNFFDFVMNNYKPETAILVARVLISEYRLPFNTQRMRTFDGFASLVAKSLVAAG